MREISVFSGTAHPELAEEICGHLGVPLQPATVRRFANDCLEVQLQSNCRERDVFLIQPLSALADLLVTAGASRVLTMTLHSPQVHGFFSVPVDHLHALREIADHFAGQDLSGAVVVSPDLGNAKAAAALARMLGLPVAAGAKERISDDEVTITSIIGDVAGRNVIVLDDEIARGTTIIELLGRLREHGARSVRIACTHGLFCDGAVKRIAAWPEVQEIVCTNSVAIAESEGTDRLHVISVGPALAEAIRRIHEGESVSALFHDQ